MNARLITGMIVLGLTRPSIAGAAPGCIDPASANVWMVESGELWRSASGVGNYRVIITKQGVEESLDRVQVQLVRINGSTRAITRCIDLDSPGLQGYVKGVRIHSISDSAAAIELSIEMKAMQNIALQDVFLVSVEGKVKQIQKARYSDVSDFE